jgi:hypothetical protein
LQEILVKALFTLFVAIAVTATGTAAASSSLAPNRFNALVMPVLVQVSSSGKVTSVSPSTELEPRYMRMLRENIQELVSGPAMNRRGGIASQFIMNVTLKTAPRADGSFDAHFAYVSAHPLPAVALHWLNIDGVRTVLVRDDDTFQRRSQRSYPNANLPYSSQPSNRFLSAPSYASPIRNAPAAPQRSNDNQRGQ